MIETVDFILYTCIPQIRQDSYSDILAHIIIVVWCIALISHNGLLGLRTRLQGTLIILHQRNTQG